MPRKFRYRLEPVLNVRRIEEDRDKRTFGAAARHVDEQSRLIDGLSDDQGRARTAFALERARAIDLTRLRLEEGYLIGLQRRIRRAGVELIKRLQVREERRKVFVEARKKVRVLERLRERRLRQHRLEVDREEQKILDETASARRRAPLAGDKS